MKHTELYVIRHGQSEGNLQDLFLGHKDLDLTELGKKQALCVANFFHKIPVDAIFSSDLLRAYHTACPLAEMKGLSITKDAALREIYAGEWEGLSVPELNRKYPETSRVWWTDTGNGRPDGGESVEEVQKRVLSAVTGIAEDHLGQTVCIFSHFTPIYALKTAWAKVPLREMKHQPKPKNASVTHVRYENGAFQLVRYAFNDYLGDLASDFSG